MSTSAKVRQGQILELANTSGLASVEELSERFGVTASTIRRDLSRLTTEGKIARTYGGAMPLTSPVIESTFRQRNMENAAGKSAIGRKARSLVTEGQTILLDSGSTVAALAHELRDATELTVATTSLVVVEELIEVEQVHVECIGGTLRHRSAAFVGPLAEYGLERMSFDAVFLGADAVTPEAICEADLVQTRLKEKMSSRAARVFVLADHSKLNQHPFHAWAKLPDGWTLITDAQATCDQLKPFQDAKVNIMVAD
ncbi:DeoR/GlpR family DNA-binding transcription regulator [Glutamicibacter sp. JC586]|uniref:DeoR/GlpR family DNA-binding transcription regulator n=1 Tax=Glutamicibacter sp. JC586 TaxID=2590552 RepID=UPI00135CD575|nr:DeoR/GlpR family DNA-binding transcription regulator [Glutamicibacter sp. JC586]